MIAALPMYDRPSTAAGWDRLWAGVRDRLRAAGVPAPDKLDRDTPIWTGWEAPDLLLGQICNLPLRARLWDSGLSRLGCADNGLPGTPAGHYHSVVITRPGADRTQAAHRFAYNEALSHSGWGAAWDWAGGEGLTLTPMLATGAHAGSLAAVAEGRADMAVLDAVSWALLQTDLPQAAASVTVISRTRPSPGMTYVTRHPRPDLVRAALAEAIAELSAQDRAQLHLHGFTALPETAYDLPLPPDPQAVAAS